MSDPIKIKVMTAPKWKPLRASYVFALQFIMIGAGVLADSPAMQWMGFVMVILCGIVAIAMQADRQGAMSIDEARKRLDELEAEQKTDS